MKFDFLLLWSGHVPGMKKARIPAVEHNGFCGVHRGGKLWIPDRDAIRAALPHKFRAAFDRDSKFMWYDNRGNDYPATVTLCYAKNGRAMVTLYLQPLEGSE